MLRPGRTYRQVRSWKENKNFTIVVQVDPDHSIISRVMNDGVDTVLLASSGTIMLHVLPNHFPAQCTVVNLACPAEDMVVVLHLLEPENAVFSSPIINRYRGECLMHLMWNSRQIYLGIWLATTWAWILSGSCCCYFFPCLFNSINLCPQRTNIDLLHLPWSISAIIQISELASRK
jgi:hypothetical protein